MLNFAINKNRISIFLIFLLFSFNSLSEIIAKNDVITLYINTANSTLFTGTVIDVTDGDTINVKRDDTGETERIRILGINTPEKGYEDENGQYINDPEPYAIEATNFTYNLVYGKKVTVYIAKDPYYQTDSYGRILGVVVSGKMILNIELLREGLAKRLFYNENPIIKFEQWVKAEGSARKRKINLWSHYHQNRIVITEVYPDPPGNETDTGKEFIEIKNFGKKPVNLKNWLFMMDRDTRYRQLTQSDFILNPGEVCVVSTVDEQTFRGLFPSIPSNAKYLKSEDIFYFANYPNPVEQRIFYLVTPEKYIEEVLTFSLDWYDGVRNGGKSLHRTNFREIEYGSVDANSPDKSLFYADNPDPGVVQ